MRLLLMRIYAHLVGRTQNNYLRINNHRRVVGAEGSKEGRKQVPRDGMGMHASGRAWSRSRSPACLRRLRQKARCRRSTRGELIYPAGELAACWNATGRASFLVIKPRDLGVWSGAFFVCELIVSTYVGNPDPSHTQIIPKPATSPSTLTRNILDRAQ